MMMTGHHGEAMANQCNVDVLEEVSASQPDGWKLSFQWCRYRYADQPEENGYRFIWKRPGTGHLQAARGQARIPSIVIAQELISKAVKQGWGTKQGVGADLLSLDK
jgi:hypothetical protein